MNFFKSLFLLAIFPALSFANPNLPPPTISTVPLQTNPSSNPGLKWTGRLAFKWNTLGGDADWTSRTTVYYEHREEYSGDSLHGFYYNEVGLTYRTLDEHWDFGLAFRYARLAKDQMADGSTFKTEASMPYIYATPSMRFFDNHFKISNRFKMEGVVTNVDTYDILLKSKPQLEYDFVINDNWKITPFVADEITLETVSGAGFTKNRVQVGAKVNLYEYFEVDTFYEYNSNLISGGKESDLIGFNFNITL